MEWLSRQNIQDQGTEAHLWFEKLLQIEQDKWEQKKWHKLQFLYDFRDYEASWLLETTE